MVTPVTREPTATPALTVVSPAEVDAVPPILKFVASENANRPFGDGYDADARPTLVDSVCPSKVSFNCAIWLSLQLNSKSVHLQPTYVKGWTVVPEICGRPTWIVEYSPALLPYVWICFHAVVAEIWVGVVTDEPRACFHQKPMLLPTAVPADPSTCSIVRSPFTSNCDWTVRLPRLNACPAFSPIPSRKVGLNWKFSDRNS